VKSGHYKRKSKQRTISGYIEKAKISTLHKWMH